MQKKQKRNFTYIDSKKRRKKIDSLQYKRLMDNFCRDDPSPNIWNNLYESINSEPETDYCIISSKSGLNDSLFTSPSSEMQHDNDQVNEMVQLLLSPSCNSATNNSIFDNINSALYPLPEIFNQTSQELQIHNATKENVSVLFNPIGSSNFSSGESEATSQCSSQSNPSKRKLEDMYFNPYEYLPRSMSSGITTAEKGFQMYFDKPLNSKKRKQEECPSKNIDFRQESSQGNISYEPDTEAIAHVKEMIYRAAAMRPINLVLEEAAVVEKPKRKNVKISTDPQTVAARNRRERIGERLRILQRLVPGGSKMDTASMLDEAANYLKFLKSQISALENMGANSLSSDNCFQLPLNLQSTLFNP